MIFLLFIFEMSQVQVITPVTLATQEAEIRRMVGGSQPGKIVLDTLS
jgi:hypothetical protein